MIVKILILLSVLIVLVFIESLLLKKQIRTYHFLTWSLVEFFWYMISFAAVCIGLAELERIQQLNVFKEKEKALTEEYYDKKNLLHAQTWLLRIDSTLTSREEDGVKWFHKMKALFDEGLYAPRWEGFLNYSRSFVLKERGVYADVASNSLEYGWPKNLKIKPEELFLREEIIWVIDILKKFKDKKDDLQKIRPEENTNYQIRYFLIFFFLVGLSLKILKIYADYRRTKPRV